jgi:hypothetical protein
VLRLVAGLASGAAMLPYTVIKEANPPEVSGSATGVVNFLYLQRPAGPGVRGILVPWRRGIDDARALPDGLRAAAMRRRWPCPHAPVEGNRSGGSSGRRVNAASAVARHKGGHRVGRDSRRSLAERINVRAFIQRNYEPYYGDEAFLALATARTQRIWETLTRLFVEERRKGVLDISQIPSSITAHAPGYIDREHEIIVGLQTEAPLKRAIMPNGGFRMVANALKAYGRSQVVSVRSTETRNEGVSMRHVRRRRCRSSHILTGLPDAYGRGRIIGDYRRVALYGVNRLVERKQQEKAALDAALSTDDIIRDREELAEQIRALKELLKMAAAYGFDLSEPAAAQEAVSGSISAISRGSRSRTARRCRSAVPRRSSTCTSRATSRPARSRSRERRSSSTTS